MSIHFRTIFYIVFYCAVFLKLPAQIISPFRKEIKEPSSQDSITKPFQWKQDTVVLGEAVILPYNNYESFKQAFISLETDRQSEFNMIHNWKLLSKQIEVGVNPDMDAFANYRNKFTYNLIRSDGFILFSSVPGKGIPIIPWIKKVID
ncbi:MAG: hypothetical protein JW830_05935 [Bacteroidales bacterium]|nr:hypothetical protein [Bacteroidales bacterium]